MIGGRKMKGCKIAQCKLKVISKTKNEHNNAMLVHLVDDRNDAYPKQSTYAELKIDIYQPLIQELFVEGKYYIVDIIPTE